MAEYDAICSLGCGAGVQALAERFPKTPVYPGLNTQFIGILESQGVWTEKCAGCGNCRLGEFAGICPITRCAKRQFNGPCGGSQDGKCEVNPDLDCAWQLIYDRAKSTGQSSTSLEAIAAAAGLVDRPGRRPAESGPRGPVHRRPGAEGITRVPISAFAIASGSAGDSSRCGLPAACGLATATANLVSCETASGWIATTQTTDLLRGTASRRFAMERVSHQDLAQELPGTGHLRIVEDLAGRALLDDLPVGQHHDPVGRTPGEADLVRDDDQRQPVAFEVLQDGQHLAFQLRVQAHW